MASNLLKGEYLVAYDYDTGAVWATVAARSREDITSRYPQLTVYDSPPSWMSEKQRTSIRREGIVDIESGPVPRWMTLSNDE